jgi:hypothetical protein
MATKTRWMNLKTWRGSALITCMLFNSLFIFDSLILVILNTSFFFFYLKIIFICSICNTSHINELTILNFGVCKWFKVFSCSHLYIGIQISCLSNSAINNRSPQIKGKWLQVQRETIHTLYSPFVSYLHSIWFNTLNISQLCGYILWK